MGVESVLVGSWVGGGVSGGPGWCGVDGGDQQSVVDDARRIVNLHDTGVVDQDVELRILGDELLCYRGDALRVLKVQLDRDYSGIRLPRCFQMRFPPTGNDDQVPAFVQRLREATSDPRTTTCDENRVSCENHGLFPFRQTDPNASARFQCCAIMNRSVHYDARNPLGLHEYCTEQFNTS